MRFSFLVIDERNVMENERAKGKDRKKAYYVEIEGTGENESFSNMNANDSVNN